MHITLDARCFAASSLGLWFSEESDPNPAGVLAVVVPPGEVLGESSGVNGRSGEESEATEERDQFHPLQQQNGGMHGGTLNVFLD